MAKTGGGGSDPQTRKEHASSKVKPLTTGSVRKKIQENESTNREMLQHFIGARFIPAKRQDITVDGSGDDYSYFPPSLAPTLPTSIHVVTGHESNETGGTGTGKTPKCKETKLRKGGKNTIVREGQRSNRSTMQSTRNVSSTGASLAEKAACIGCVLGAPVRPKEDHSRTKSVTVYWDASRQQRTNESVSLEQASSMAVQVPENSGRKREATKESTSKNLSESSSVKRKTNGEADSSLPWVFVPGVL